MHFPSFPKERCPRGGGVDQSFLSNPKNSSMHGGRVFELDVGPESCEETETNGWTVISMKDDWRKIFAFERCRHGSRRLANAARTTGISALAAG
jgi:hypothetical protein